LDIDKEMLVMEDRRRRFKRRPVLLVLLALIASAALAIPALGEPTKEVTVDPGAAATASGFTDLDTLTYAQAKDRLDRLSQITLPVQIPGLERLRRRRPLALAVGLGHRARPGRRPARHGGLAG
jgi:hypothetical protein